MPVLPLTLGTGNGHIRHQGSPARRYVAQPPVTTIGNADADAGRAPGGVGGLGI